MQTATPPRRTSRVGCWRTVNPTTRVPLPAMGESVREGTVLEWHKQEGDAVAEGETIVEVSTDKVDAEVPAPASGTLTRIIAAAGETIAVGDVLGEIANGGPPTPAPTAEPDPEHGEGGARVTAPEEPGGELPRHVGPAIVG